MKIFLIILISYLIGSIPTAYLIVKKINKIDITKSGSGNVGAYNTFFVTGSKIYGLLTLITDLLKGLLPVLFIRLFWNDNFIYFSIATFFLVLGHCYSPWIKFKGGKGLATSAGATICFAPMITIIWILIWFISFLYKRNIDFSNIAASIILIALTILNPDFIGNNIFAKPPEPNNYYVVTFVIFLMLVVLIKHISAFKSLFLKKQNSGVIK